MKTGTFGVMAKQGVINIIGPIDGVNVSLVSVMEQVNAQPKAKEYLVNINSPGGEITEGYAIHNYLIGLGVPVTTRGIGLVASIATVIFLAGKKRQLYQSTQFLIHNPWTFGEGDADAMERKATELRDMENELVKFYVSQTGSHAETLKDLMNADRFITADQALELRFATEILTPVLAYATIKQKPIHKDKMTKLGKILKTAFAALQDAGVVLNESVMTADGQELEITMAGSTIAAGDTVTLNGEPATGEFTLADGQMIKVDAGVIIEVMAAPVEGVPAEEVENLKAQINALKAEIKTLKSENEEAMESLEVITNHLRRLKINASVPGKRPSFNKTGAPVNPSSEMNKDEVKARIAELKAKTQSRTTIAI